MRIISGKYRSRQIQTPTNLPVRPTTDFAKESLFNILNNLVDFEGLKVLDLFAGTGNLSYEFFSRGASLVTAVENERKCSMFIERTAELLNADCINVFRTDVFQFLKHPYGNYDVIFADPPYDMEELDTLPDKVFKAEILSPDGWFILEHSKRHKFQDFPFFDQQRTYGNVNFSFFRKKD
jgi:16S rRNA (guanine966-N2)-methyltransferase